jgi:hypothetical protein
MKSLMPFVYYSLAFLMGVALCLAVTIAALRSDMLVLKTDIGTYLCYKHQVR